MFSSSKSSGSRRKSVLLVALLLVVLMVLPLGTVALMPGSFLTNRGFARLPHLPSAPDAVMQATPGGSSSVASSGSRTAGQSDPEQPNCWLQDCEYNGNGYVCIFGEPWTELNDCKVFFDKAQPLNLNDQGITALGAGALASAIPLDPVTSVALITAVIVDFEGQGFSVPDRASLIGDAAIPWLLYCIGCNVPDHSVLDGLRYGVPLASGVAGAIIGALGGGGVGAVVGAIAGVALGIIVVSVVFAFAAVLEAVVCGYVRYYCNGSDITANLIGNPDLQRHPMPLELARLFAALGVSDAPAYLGDVEGWGLPTFDTRDRSQVAHNATLIGSAGPNNVNAPIMCAVGQEVYPLITFDGDAHIDLQDFQLQGINGIGMNVNSLLNVNNFRNGPGGTSPPNALLIEVPLADRSLFMGQGPGQADLEQIAPGSILRICGHWVADTDSSELWLELHPVTSIDFVPYFTIDPKPVSPNPITIGGTGTFAISLTSYESDGSSLAVTSTILGPPGTSPVIIPPATITLTPNGVVQANMTISTSTATTPGIYTVNVTATGQPELCTTQACFTPVASTIISFIVLLPGCTSSLTLPCWVNPPEYMNHQSSLIATGLSEVQANCNPGDIATGGGFDRARDGVTAFESRPILDGTSRPVGWIAGFNNSGGVPSGVDASVDCMTGVLASSQASLVHVVSVTGSVAARVVSNIIAPCVSGDFATGGGFLSDSESLRVVGSGPTPVVGKPTGWNASFRNLGAVLPHNGEAITVCMTPPASNPSLSTYVRTRPTFVDAAHVHPVIATCNLGQPVRAVPDYATGGGFFSFNQSLRIIGTGPTPSSFRPFLQWSVGLEVIPSAPPSLELPTGPPPPPPPPPGHQPPPIRIFYPVTAFAVCMTPVEPFTSATTAQHFSLSSTVTDLSVIAGETASYTVHISSLDGSTGSSAIALTVVSTLPPGATAQFNPPNVVPSQSPQTTLQVSTTSISIGEYALTIQGDSGSVTNSTVVNLHVYDYDIISSPSDKTVLRGSSTSYQVNLTLVPGSSTVGVMPQSLTVSGQPPDATSYLTSRSVMPTLAGTSTMLAIATAGPPNEPLGNFTLTVNGRDPTGEIRLGSANLHIYDFSASLSGSETVLKGGQGTYTVTTTLTPGSSNTGIPPVAFIISSGLPTDASATFSRSAIPTAQGNTSNLVITTGLSSLGDYHFLVVGTDGRTPEGGVRTVTGQLHLYDFALSLSHDETVLRGAQGIYTITATLAPGSSQVNTPSVAFSISNGLPSDASPRIGGLATPTITGAISTLTVATGPSSLGDYAFAITANDARSPEGGSRYVTGNLHLYDFSLSAPSSVSVLTTGKNSLTETLTLSPGSTAVGLPAISLSFAPPAGLGLALNANFIPGGGYLSFTSTFNIATYNTPAGNYTLTLIGSDTRSIEGGQRSISTELMVLKPQQALQLVANQVNTFQSSGVLNMGQAGSLTAKLSHILAELNMGDNMVACNQLAAFVNQVKSYLATGILTQGQANLLLGGPLGVYAIGAAIPC